MRTLQFMVCLILVCFSTAEESTNVTCVNQGEESTSKKSTDTSSLEDDFSQILKELNIYPVNDTATTESSTVVPQDWKPTSDFPSKHFLATAPTDSTQMNNQLQPSNNNSIDGDETSTNAVQKNPLNGVSQSQRVYQQSLWVNNEINSLGQVPNVKNYLSNYYYQTQGSQSFLNHIPMQSPSNMNMPEQFSSRSNTPFPNSPWLSNYCPCQNYINPIAAYTNPTQSFPFYKYMTTNPN